MAHWSPPLRPLRPLRPPGGKAGCSLCSQALTALVLALVAAPAIAERLPITTYRPARAPDDTIRCAFEDDRGFVWFGSDRGLYRFDGKTFRLYAGDHGLSEASVRGIAEDEDGSLIVLTTSDIYRFEPAGGGLFKSLTNGSPPWPHGHVCLVRARNGTLWVGTLDGLFRFRHGSSDDPSPKPVTAGWERVPIPAPRGYRNYVLALLEDRERNLWVASRYLYRISPDGRVLGVGSHLEDAANVQSLSEDEYGNIWISGWEFGIRRVAPASGRLVTLPVPGIGHLNGTGLVASRPGGGVWVGTTHGILEIDPVRGVVRTITTKQGLQDDNSQPLLVDKHQNFWISILGGVSRLATGGLSSYGRTDGVEQPRIAAIFRSHGGEVVGVGAGSVIYRLDGERFVAIHPALPRGIVDLGWGWNQWVLEDSRGDWWIPTGQGIVRFPPVKRLEHLARARPLAHYSVKSGLPSDKIFRLFEDSHADVWISLLGTVLSAAGFPRSTLVRWERSTGRFHAYGPEHGVPNQWAPTAFCEHPAGVLWVAFSGPHGPQVFRLRDGRFERLFEDHETDGGYVNAFHTDRQGQLWLATDGAGACRVQDTQGAHPSLSCLSTKQGLASDRVLNIVEDGANRLYLGTSQGLDVLDPNTGRIVHLDERDGLPHPVVSVAMSDPELGLWFGTLEGIAHLDPVPRLPKPPDPPRVLIDGIHVAGIARPLSAFGETVVPDITLGPDEQHLEIDLLGLTSGPADRLRFQYRIQESASWSDPVEDRSISLAHLASGAYRFEARALDVSGVASMAPATFSFRILPPVYRRAWFLFLSAGVFAALIVIVYRARVGYLLALERQRTGIAMDLHDEIGSGLGSIGLLADLGAAEQTGESARRDHLDRIASMASELGASMADIVWSLRPGSESLESLARRLVERGRGLFPGGAGAALETRFPSSWPEAHLSLSVRHNVLLVAQEALHNAARHSGARRVVLEIAPRGERWMLQVADDGGGMPEGSGASGPSNSPERPLSTRAHAGGFGLETMHRRAKAIGAALDVASRPGEGTTVTLVFDLRAEERNRPI